MLLVATIQLNLKKIKIFSIPIFSLQISHEILSCINCLHIRRKHSVSSVSEINQRFDHSDLILNISSSFPISINLFRSTQLVRPTDWLTYSSEKSKNGINEGEAICLFVYNIKTWNTKKNKQICVGETDFVNVSGSLVLNVFSG